MAVIYARYNGDNPSVKHRGGSFEGMREYAEKNGITILRSYIDGALSTPETDNRPEFQAWCRTAQKGCLIPCWSQTGSKLAQPLRQRPLQGGIRRNGVKVVSATENISYGRRVLFWNPCWKEWRNIIRRNWHRKSTGSYRKRAER